MSKQTKRKTGLPRLLQIAGAGKWFLLTSISLAIGSTLAGFTPFVSVYKILSELSKNASDPSLLDQEYIWHWAKITLWGFILFGILLFASIMFSHIAAFNILYNIRMSLAKKLVKLPMGFFTKRASGDIKKVMSEDVERIELFIAHHIPDITSAIIFPVLVIGYMFTIDWRLALVVTAVFAVAITMMSLMSSSPKMKPIVDKYLSIMGKMNNSIVEYVRGIQVVKIFSHSTKSFERLNKDINEFNTFSNKVTKQYAPVYLSFYLLLSSLLLFIIPTAVILLVNSPSYSEFIPKALMFIILGGGMFFPLLKLMWIGSMMSQNSIGVGLIDDILDKEEIDDPTSPSVPQNSNIDFINVSFAYDQKKVLNDISFKAKANTVTALVGPSGSGKTTIAMLTARFWDIDSGDIFIGDTPIKEIATSTLMNHISFVFQDNMLFFDTIEENIRMGNKAASREQVVEAAKSAQCHDFIEKLDKGYSTLVGEGGTDLSGGEQQRIALARAILKDSPIILLDEATAYADPENEGKILKTFSKLIKDKTVIVIAHRLSTITNADQILYIDNGEIIEQGTHNELLNINGNYSKMWESYSQSRDWVLNQEEVEELAY